MNKRSGSKAQMAQKPLPNRGADQSTSVKNPAKAHDLQINEFCNRIPLTADIRAPTIGLTLGSGTRTPASPPPRVVGHLIAPARRRA